MSQFSNKEQESEFQKILERVNSINFLTENDLRKMFCAGMDFGVCKEIAKVIEFKISKKIAKVIESE